MMSAEALLAHDFGKTSAEYVPRDAILYALGLGLGQDALDPGDLAYMDETSLSVLPSFAVTLASPGMWIRDARFGVDFAKLVHSAQAAWFETPLPPAAEVIGTARVLSLTDRGGGKGAVLVVEREIRDASSGCLYCRLQQTLLLRGDGGFGGPATPRLAEFTFEGAPDLVTLYPTSPRAALIYRLSGDWNPLHLRPDVAQTAGFDRPILQGLASYGVAGYAISRALGRDPADLAQLSCRFSGVVVPGETLSFSIWKAIDGAAHFQAQASGRSALDAGYISWRQQ